MSSFSSTGPAPDRSGNLPATATSATATATSTTQTTAIRRLAIFHVRMAEMCAGYNFDEGASNEELAEQILYYYSSEGSNHYYDRDGAMTGGGGHHDDDDGTEIGVDVADPSSHRHSCKEAVQFAGLCSALYSLPSSLNITSTSSSTAETTATTKSNGIGIGNGGPRRNAFEEEEEEEDCTREVRLTDSSLVFETLEDPDHKIVAVAQVRRRCPERTGGGTTATTTTTTITPAAVGAALRRTHKMFCLLRGGGVHARLSKGRGEDGDDGGPYPGMRELYRQRKLARKRRDAARKKGGGGDDDDDDDEYRRIVVRIRELNGTLPIRSLRRDLRIHYDAFLEELWPRFGSCRCVVQCVPAPIPVKSGSHRSVNAPHSPNPYVIAHLGALLQDAMGGTLRSRCRFRMLGISVFLRGRLVRTFPPDSESDDDDGEEEEEEAGEVIVSNETASMLMWYMSSFRLEMDRQRDSAAERGSVPAAPKRAFRPLAVQFAVGWDAQSSSSSIPPPQPPSPDSNHEVPSTPAPPTAGRFLEPPPPSLTSASDDEPSSSPPEEDDRDGDDGAGGFGGGGGGGAGVWTPRVFLPRTTATATDHAESRACLYEYDDDWSFLMYLGGGGGGGGAAVTATPRRRRGVVDDDGSFRRVAEAVDDAMATALGAGAASGTTVPDVETRMWGEEGQDVVFVDRDEHATVLFSHRIRESDDDRNGADDKDKKKFKKKRIRAAVRETARRFFKSDSSGSDSVGSFSDYHRYGGGGDDNDRSASDLDCRYRLASHLTPETMSAFDDAIIEARARRTTGWRRRRKHASSRRYLHDDEYYGYYETCSFLPQGWMFSCCRGNRELYVLFDSSVYVTIADVQSAASRIRSRLLSGLME